MVVVFKNGYKTVKVNMDDMISLWVNNGTIYFLIYNEISSFSINMGSTKIANSLMEKYNEELHTFLTDPINAPKVLYLEGLL